MDFRISELQMWPLTQVLEDQLMRLEVLELAVLASHMICSYDCGNFVVVYSWVDPFNTLCSSAHHDCQQEDRLQDQHKEIAILQGQICCCGQEGDCLALSLISKKLTKVLTVMMGRRAKCIEGINPTIYYYKIPIVI